MRTVPDIMWGRRKTSQISNLEEMEEMRLWGCGCQSHGLGGGWILDTGNEMTTVCWLQTFSFRPLPYRQVAGTPGNQPGARDDAARLCWLGAEGGWCVFWDGGRFV